MRKGSMLVAVILIGVMILGGMRYAAEVTASYEPVGVSYIHNGYLGNSISAEEEFDLEYPAAYDLLDATQYVTAWDATDHSEKIIVRGQVLNTGGPLVKLWCQYQYRITFSSSCSVFYNGNSNPSSETWNSPWFGSDSGLELGEESWNSLQSIVIYVVGPELGSIHAELWGTYIWLDYDILYSTWEDETYCFCEDEAGLVSGLANVIVPKIPVEELQTAHFTVTTGYSHSELTTGGGWTFEIFEPSDRGGNVVFTKTLDDNKVTDVPWVVPEGSYSSTGDNSFFVRLTNQLFDVAHDYMFVIGIGMTEQIPFSPTIIALDGDPPYAAGSTPGFRLEVEKNPDGYDVASFQVWVQLSDSSGGSGPYLIQGASYPATYDQGTGFYWATFEFEVQQEGWYKIQASTVDIMHLNSPMASLVVTTSGVDTDGGDTGGDDVDYMNLILGIVAVFLGFLICILVFMYVPKPYGIILGVLLLVVFLVVGGYFILEFIEAMEAV